MNRLMQISKAEIYVHQNIYDIISKTHISLTHKGIIYVPYIDDFAKKKNNNIELKYLSNIIAHFYYTYK